MRIRPASSVDVMYTSRVNGHVVVGVVSGASGDVVPVVRVWEGMEGGVRG